MQRQMFYCKNRLKKYRKVTSVVLISSVLLSSMLLLNPLRWVVAASYPSQVVSRGLLDVSVQAPGLLQSGVYNLAFQGISGNIQEIDVKQGQSVVRGQLLARLDPILLQQSVSVAQTSLDAARKNLSGVLLHQGDTIHSVNARIASVQEVVHAVEAFVKATNRDANVSAIVAQATLKNDQRTLSDTRKAADAQVKQAEAQRQHDLAACPTPTPTSTALATAAAISAGSTTNSNSVSSLPIPISDSLNITDASTPTAIVDNSKQVKDAQQQTDTVSASCVQLANAIYKQQVGVAHLNVTSFTAQVKKDQQEIDQTDINSEVNNAGANSQLANGYDQVVNAETNTDITANISQVESAEGQLETATAQLDIAQYNLAHSGLTAPHDGIVTAINGTLGGPPGFPADTANGMSAPYGIFIQIVDLSSVQQIIANVSETDIVTVQVGQPIQFHLKAYNDRQFSGTVRAISPNGIAGGGGITYPIITTIDPSNTEGTDMLPNMTASVTITILYDKNALRLPASAIDSANNGKGAKKVASLVSGQQSSAAMGQAMGMLKQMIKAHPNLVNHKPFPAFVVEQSGQDNTFIAKPVVLGLTDGTYYEVLQGVSENEHIIVGK